MDKAKSTEKQSTVPVKKETAPTPWVTDFFAPLPAFPSSLSPFAMMREFTNQMDRFFSGKFPEAAATPVWSPVIDVRTQNGDLVVTAEVPGLTKDEVKVELAGNALIIEGDRKREKEEEGEGVYRCERSYGHFYRAIPLPEGAKTEQVKAELHDGILKVTLPIPAPEKKSRQVPISEH